MEKELSNLKVSTEDVYFTSEQGMITTRGYGQTHNLGKGWSVRVDKPKAGDGQQKPHVHVKKGKIEAKENVDGTSSHGRGNTMNDKKVPKDIQKKVRDHKDYKKAKKDLDKMKTAKSKIKAKKLNLKKYKDIVIAIGIFVTVVDLVILATTSVWGWGAFLLAI